MPQPQQGRGRSYELFPGGGNGSPMQNTNNNSQYGPPPGDPRQFYQNGGQPPQFMPQNYMNNRSYSNNRYPMGGMDMASHHHTNSYHRNMQNPRHRGGGRHWNRNGRIEEKSYGGDVRGGRESTNLAGGGIDSSGQDEQTLSRTNLYIRGLPAGTTDEDLLQMCQGFGKILSTKAIYDSETQECKGYGFVDFEKSEEAEAAMMALKQRGILAQMAKAKQQQERDETNLYVANLPVHLSESDLQVMFEPFGTVVSTKILTQHGGISRGVGFVRMETRQACEAIISVFNGKLLPRGNLAEPLVVKFADGGNKKKQQQAENNESGSEWNPDSEYSDGTLTGVMTSSDANGCDSEILNIHERSNDYDSELLNIHEQLQQLAMTAVPAVDEGIDITALLGSLSRGAEDYTSYSHSSLYPTVTGPAANTAVPNTDWSSWSALQQLYNSRSDPPSSQNVTFTPSYTQHPAVSTIAPPHMVSDVRSVRAGFNDPSAPTTVADVARQSSCDLGPAVARQSSCDLGPAATATQPDLAPAVARLFAAQMSHQQPLAPPTTAAADNSIPSAAIL